LYLANVYCLARALCPFAFVKDYTTKASPQGLSEGEIAGIVVGCLAAVVLIIGFIPLCKRQTSKKSMDVSFPFVIFFSLRFLISLPPGCSIDNCF